MRYFRLKNARKWKICQSPNATRAKRVNHAKFCTRLFVDTVGAAQAERSACGHMQGKDNTYCLLTGTAPLVL